MTQKSNCCGANMTKTLTGKWSCNECGQWCAAIPAEENHCTGCIGGDPTDEGRTHQMETIEHPAEENWEVEIKKEVAGLSALINQIEDSGQAHIAEMKLGNILRALEKLLLSKDREKEEALERMRKAEIEDLARVRKEATIAEQDRILAIVRDKMEQIDKSESSAWQRYEMVGELADLESKIKGLNDTTIK